MRLTVPITRTGKDGASRELIDQEFDELNAKKRRHAKWIPSVGLGTDYRLESRKMTGFALALDDQILHLCMFARDSHESGSKMEKFSTRRRNRV